MEAFVKFFNDLPSGFYALAGSALMALATFGGQMLIQRQENKRALRRLAYEMAVSEWRVLVENKLIFPDNRCDHLSSFIKANLAMVAVLNKRYDPHNMRDIEKLVDKLMTDLTAAPSAEPGDADSVQKGQGAATGQSEASREQASNN